MRSRILLALITVALFAFPAVADDGFFIGASVGQSDITTADIEDLEDFSIDDDITGYKVFAGYRFLKFFAVEGAYIDFGTAETELVINPGVSEFSLDGYEVQGVFYLPLGIADIFAKGGLFEWSADLQTTGLSQASIDGSDPVYGAGVQFRIKSFAIRAEVEYFDVEATEDLYMYSLGASITF
jgi:OOP family OmpA-OmpF porin